MFPSATECAAEPNLGPGFCHQHDPQAVAAKQAKREAKWQRERAREQAARNRRRLGAQAFSAFRSLTEAQAEVIGFPETWCAIQDWLRDNAEATE